MGMFRFNDKETLSLLYESDIFGLDFNEEDSLSEVVNVITPVKKKSIVIYVRNKNEAGASHYCSVKACEGGIDGKQSNKFVSYPVPNYIHHTINSINDISLDKKCKDKSFDSKYGKIVKTFIMNYHKEIIDYWEATTLAEMDAIKLSIINSLKQNNSEYKII